MEYAPQAFALLGPVARLFRFSSRHSCPTRSFDPCACAARSSGFILQACRESDPYRKHLGFRYRTVPGLCASFQLPGVPVHRPAPDCRDSQRSCLRPFHPAHRRRSHTGPSGLPRAARSRLAPHSGPSPREAHGLKADISQSRSSIEVCLHIFRRRSKRELKTDLILGTERELSNSFFVWRIQGSPRAPGSRSVPSRPGPGTPNACSVSTLPPMVSGRHLHAPPVQARHQESPAV